jgi:hypothetical protein
MQGMLVFQVMALNGTRRTHFSRWQVRHLHLIKVPMLRGEGGSERVGDVASGCEASTAIIKCGIVRRTVLKSSTVYV